MSGPSILSQEVILDADWWVTRDSRGCVVILTEEDLSQVGHPSPGGRELCFPELMMAHVLYGCENSGQSLHLAGGPQVSIIHGYFVFDNLGSAALGCGNQVPSLWLLVLLVRSVRDGSHRLWCGIVGLLDYWGFLPGNFRL